MQTHVAITHAKHGIYRIVGFIAWVTATVTFLAIIGYVFSDDTDIHSTIVLVAILGASVGTLLLLPSAVHHRHQKTIATILLVAGILACIFI